MKAEQELVLEELEAELTAFMDTMANKPGGPRTRPGCNLVHGRACALGTCVDNIPRVTPIDFYHDGLTSWIAGEPGGKIANIMRNPNVSIGIYEPVDHTKRQKSLQIWGTAELINMKNDPGEFLARFEQFGLAEAMKGMIEEHTRRGALPDGGEDASYGRLLKMFNLIKVTPTQMILLDMTPGQFPVRKVWVPGRAFIKARG